MGHKGTQGAQIKQVKLMQKYYEFVNKLSAVRKCLKYYLSHLALMKAQRRLLVNWCMGVKQHTSRCIKLGPQDMHIIVWSTKMQNGMR